MTSTTKTIEQALTEAAELIRPLYVADVDPYTLADSVRVTGLAALLCGETVHDPELMLEDLLEVAADQRAVSERNRRPGTKCANLKKAKTFEAAAELIRDALGLTA